MDGRMKCELFAGICFLLLVTDNLQFEECVCSVLPFSAEILLHLISVFDQAK